MAHVYQTHHSDRLQVISPVWYWVSSAEFLVGLALVVALVFLVSPAQPSEEFFGQDAQIVQVIARGGDLTEQLGATAAGRRLEASPSVQEVEYLPSLFTKESERAEASELPPQF